MVLPEFQPQFKRLWLDQSELDSYGHKKMNLTAGVFNFMRVASAAPKLRVADVECNVAQIRAAMEITAKRGASIILIPELSLTGYTCADLFRHPR
jgi:hypothetical protein